MLFRVKKVILSKNPLQIGKSCVFCGNVMHLTWYDFYFISWSTLLTDVLSFKESKDKNLWESSSISNEISSHILQWLKLKHSFHSSILHHRLNHVVRWPCICDKKKCFVDLLVSDMQEYILLLFKIIIVIVWDALKYFIKFNVLTKFHEITWFALQFLFYPYRVFPFLVHTGTKTSHKNLQQNSSICDV